MPPKRPAAQSTLTKKRSVIIKWFAFSNETRTVIFLNLASHKNNNYTVQRFSSGQSTTTFSSLTLFLFVVFMGNDNNNTAAALAGSPLRPPFVSSKWNGSQQRRQLCELVHYATLAASSHNTQCWKFRVDDTRNEIVILPDFERSCPVVDPDNHHLFATLGCATENLIVAAHARGFQTVTDASNPAEQGIRIRLTPGADASDQELFQAIPGRQVTRCEYNGQPLVAEELQKLQKAGTGQGVKVVLVTERDRMNTILDLVLQANTQQMNKPAFLNELASWIRFNEKDAASHGDGLYSVCTGNPQAPRFLGKLLFRLSVGSRSENKKITQQANSSAGFAVFVSEQDDPVHWVEAGRCYERFALTATAMGVRHAFLNQPIEEASMRPALCTALDLTSIERPDLLVRLGKGPEMPISPRRPLEEVLVE